MATNLAKCQTLHTTNDRQQPNANRTGQRPVTPVEVIHRDLTEDELARTYATMLRNRRIFDNLAKR